MAPPFNDLLNGTGVVELRLNLTQGWIETLTSHEPPWLPPRCTAYFATRRSRSSSSDLQSMHSVAVGLASSRFRPISTSHCWQ
jgi:hypothetical protein